MHEYTAAGKLRLTGCLSPANYMGAEQQQSMVAYCYLSFEMRMNVRYEPAQRWQMFTHGRLQRNEIPWGLEQPCQRVVNQLPITWIQTQQRDRLERLLLQHTQ